MIHYKTQSDCQKNTSFESLNEKSCSFCGGIVSGNQEICPHCRRKLVSYCTFCGAPMGPEEKECSQCGAPAGELFARSAVPYLLGHSALNVTNL